MKRLIVTFLITLTLAGVTHAQVDSLNMRFVGNWPFGEADAVACDEDRDICFLGSGGGVFVLDVSDPSNPVMLSDTIRTRSYIEDLFFDSITQNLYIAAGDPGFEIWNIASQDKLVKLSNNCTYPVNYITVSGSYAYVSQDGMYGADTIRVFDISNPAIPLEVGNFGFDEQVNEILVNDSLLFVGIEDTSLFILNVSNPFEPVQVGLCESVFRVVDFKVRDDNLYVADYGGIDGDSLVGTGFRIINISNPAEPQELYYLQTPLPRILCISGEYVYVNNISYPTMMVFDISTPADPQVEEMGSILYNSIVSYESKLYASHDEGLNIIDISEPELLNYIGDFEVPSTTILGVAVKDNYTFLACNGLRILDVSDPSYPEEVGLLETPSLRSIVILDEYAYVTENSPTGRFMIFDISNPTDPQEVSESQFFSKTEDLVVVDSYAYVEIGDSALAIFDITNPYNPQIAGNTNELGYFGYITGFDVSGPYAYLASRDSGLIVIDVSNPASLQLISSLEGEAEAWGIGVSEPYAYVKESYHLNDSLSVIDISNPVYPQYIESIVLRSSYKLHISGSFAYLSSFGNSISVLDISNPSDLKEAAYYLGYPSPYTDFCISNQYIFIGTGNPNFHYNNAGLQIYENLLWEGIEEEPLIEPSPIKLTSTLNYLAYEVPEEAVLDIFSADGRKVQSTKVTGKGTWEASDFASGVYFARINSPLYSARTKVLVLR